MASNRRQLARSADHAAADPVAADGRGKIVDPPNTWIDDRAKIRAGYGDRAFTASTAGQDRPNCRIWPSPTSDGAVLEDGVEMGVFTEVRSATFPAHSRVKSGTIVNREKPSDTGQGGQDDGQ